MSAPAWTPGPWAVSVSHNGRTLSVTAGAENVAVATMRSGPRLRNAQLIAAAPDMHEALLLCQGFLDRNPELRMGGAREKVASALAKARGEQA